MSVGITCRFFYRDNNKYSFFQSLSLLGKGFVACEILFYLSTKFKNLRSFQYLHLIDSKDIAGYIDGDIEKLRQILAWTRDSELHINSKKDKLLEIVDNCGKDFECVNPIF